MSTVRTAPPSGMRDFLPAELARRRHLEHLIRRIYESFGFVAVETPAVENLTTLLGKYGDEGDQLLFRLLHRRDKLTRALAGPEVGEKDLAEMGLRYDLTVPLARLLADHRTLPRFFKRYQIQPVWRADRPGKGRFREFLQCDIDITGTTSVVAEAEVCAAVAQVFTEAGLSEYTLHINDRGLLRCLIQAAGIATELEGTALTAVDKLDKIGEDGVRKELTERGLSPDQATRLLDLLRHPANLGNEQELDRLAEVLATEPESIDRIARLRELIGLLAVTPAAGHVCVDASLARGLGYYTGPIFEVRVPSLGGSLGGGGRYDGLIGMFAGTPIPAVGFSIGFERLVLVMDEKGLFGTLRTGPDVLFCRFPDASLTTVLHSAHRLRAQGLKVEIFPESPKIGKQLGYADTIGAPIAVMAGTDELAADQLTIKHLASGVQETLPFSEAAGRITAWLTSPPTKP
jgi:histidyl-tRNA synthetase